MRGGGVRGACVGMLELIVTQRPNKEKCVEASNKLRGSGKLIHFGRPMG